MYKMLKLDEIDTHSNRIKCQWRYLENYKWIYVAIIGIIDNKKVIVRINLSIQIINEQKLLLIMSIESNN